MYYPPRCGYVCRGKCIYTDDQRARWRLIVPESFGEEVDAFFDERLIGCIAKEALLELHPIAVHQVVHTIGGATTTIFHAVRADRGVSVFEHQAGLFANRHNY